MDHMDVVNNYSRIYRWLGLCIDYYSSLDEEDDDRVWADRMRKDPSQALEALVQIRMALITFRMKSVTQGPEGNHYVKRSELEGLMRDYPPDSKEVWWPVWKRFLDTVDDREWTAMWPAVDETVESLLKVHAKAGPKITS